MSEGRKNKTKKIMVLETIAKMNSGPYRWIDIVKKALSEAGLTQSYMNYIVRELVAQGFLIKQGYLYYINHEKINEYLNEYYKRRPELSK
jgi:DNA-binding MarR family transcriptional regulator